ncbi:MAG: DUF4168 domain-containing protein [Bacteroidetes bacterium]|jgi:hypothetical protein|nr:DUF4168 domain-containing protein [Bacteroidota bacterium]
MTRFTRRIGIFMLAALFLAPAALAQTGQQGQPAPPPDVEVSDTELETIAQVVVELQALQRTYAPKMKQAENRQQQMQVRKQFQQEMTQKLQSADGITPQRFGTVMRAARADSTLSNRIGQAVQTARQDGMNDGSGGNR